MLPFTTPDDLYLKLKDFVIGQDETLKLISLYLFKHCLSIEYDLLRSNRPILLLLGSTGIGKTFIVRKSSELISFKFVSINAKSICQEGWMGKSFIDLLKMELNSLNVTEWDNIIVFVDEFDKICIPEGSSTTTNHNEHIQYSLLKYLDLYNPDGCIEGGDKIICLNKQLCFIFAGNFESIRKKRHKKYVGFKYTEDASDCDLGHELIEFGMVPELVGRISEMSQLNPLTLEHYKMLISNQHFFIHRWLDFFKSKNVVYDIDEVIINCVNKAMKKNIGVRGLIQESNIIINDILSNNSDIFIEYFKDQFKNSLYTVVYPPTDEKDIFPKDDTI